MKHRRILPLGLFILSVAMATEAPPVMREMESALRWRAALAEAVVIGEEKPEATIQSIRLRPGASGLNLESDADFAIAAIDIGHRLLSQRRPAEAEIFFQAAEKALIQVVARTPDSAAKEKSRFLRKLALIRANYLNQAELARRDIEVALALQPEDMHLARFHRGLAARHPQVFKTDQGSDKGGRP